MKRVVNPRHFSKSGTYPPGAYKLFNGHAYYYVLMPEDTALDPAYIDFGGGEEVTEISLEDMNKWLSQLGRRYFWALYNGMYTQFWNPRTNTWSGKIR